MNKKKTIALACLVFIGGYFAGQESKVNQINNKLSELNMDWYQWQDVENIVNSNTINGWK